MVLKLRIHISTPKRRFWLHNQTPSTTYKKKPLWKQMHDFMERNKEITRKSLPVTETMMTKPWGGGRYRVGGREVSFRVRMLAFVISPILLNRTNNFCTNIKEKLLYLLSYTLPTWIYSSSNNDVAHKFWVHSLHPSSHTTTRQIKFVQLYPVIINEPIR